MKRKIIYLSIATLLVIGLTLKINTKEKTYLNKEAIENNKSIAVYIEQEEGTYNKTTSIPNKEDNYVLNTNKSVCNGNTNIGWNKEEWGIELNNIDREETKCYLYFDKKNTDTIHVSFGDIEVNRTTPDFSKSATTDEGIFKVEDGMYGGTSYYWRGAATTNHVIFADKCWRIVRINGDGTTRLIYNGPVKTGNTCTGNGSNSESVIEDSTGVEKYYATSDGQFNNSSYVGWTYSLGVQRTTSGTPSNAKTQTEKWYNANITGENASKVADGRFCNDRNTGQPYSEWSGYVTTWSATGTQFAYAGVDRLWNKYQPILSCPSGDVYTLKVGAITADEVEFAGGKNENNKSYYLYNRQNYWTMSPAYWYSGYAHVFYVSVNGHLNNAVDVGWVGAGLRPVINLHSDVIFSSGNGTLNNPYVVQ